MKKMSKMKKGNKKQMSEDMKEKDFGFNMQPKHPKKKLGSKKMVKKMKNKY